MYLLKHITSFPGNNIQNSISHFSQGIQLPYDAIKLQDFLSQHSLMSLSASHISQTVNALVASPVWQDICVRSVDSCVYIYFSQITRRNNLYFHTCCCKEQGSFFPMVEYIPFCIFTIFLKSLFQCVDACVVPGYVNSAAINRFYFPWVVFSAFKKLPFCYIIILPICIPPTLCIGSLSSHCSQHFP